MAESTLTMWLAGGRRGTALQPAPSLATAVQALLPSTSFDLVATLGIWGLLSRIHCLGSPQIGIVLIIQDGQHL